MTSDRFARFVLKLYPRSFRREWGEEWREVAAWHRRLRQDTPLPGLRHAAGLLADAARSVPVAYLRLLAERFRSTRPSPQPGRPAPRRRLSPRWDHMGYDLRYAIRGLLRSPMFTLAAVASLALGVGASTAIFSVVNAVLLEPLPYAAPDRLVIVWNEFPTAGLARLPVSGPQMQALRDRAGLFEDAGGIWATSRAVMHDGRPETVSAAVVTPNFFGVLGIEPRMGRTFVRGESNAAVPAGVIVSDEFWRSHFPGQTDIANRVIRIETRDWPVVGVLPPGFELLFPPDGGIPERIDLFMPLPWNLSGMAPDQHFIRVVGRLANGVDIAGAQQQVAAVAEELHQTYAQLNSTGDTFTVVPLHGDAVRNARPTLLALLGAVALLLLLSSANVASLMLARTTTRAAELSLRASLGASRRRLVQLLLSEGIVLAVVGGALGLLLGRQAGWLLWSLRPEGIARIDNVTMDGRVLAFAIGVSVLAGLVFSLAPLPTMTSVQPARALNDRTSIGGSGHHRARGLVIAAEVAISLTLLVGATLLMQSLTRLERSDLGYRPDGLLSFKVSLAEQSFPTDAERARLARELEERIGALAGVTSVGGGSHLPLKTWANWAEPAPPEGIPEADRDAFYVDHRTVTVQYFDALQARIAVGRAFAHEDDASSTPVAIVDQTYATRAFGTDDPVGRRIRASQYVNGAFTPTWVTIVGIVNDLRDRAPSRPSAGQVYLPFAQSARWELTYAVRSDRDPVTLAADVRERVTAVHGDLAAAEITLMDDLVRTALAPARFVVLLATVFSVLALCVATLGLYSVVAYNTAQRTREFGVRVALGAGRRDIVQTVMAFGLRLGVAGVVVGVPSAMGVAHLLRSMLYGVQPYHPVTLATVTVFFLAVAVVASLGPAVRATRIDPVRVMR